MLYFNNVVLPRFQLSDKHVELDLDTVLRDGPLQQAILAVSQAHYKLISKIESTDIVLARKQARQSAIESFRQLLDSGITSEDSAQQLFTVNVLLCMLDGIVEPNDDFNASLCHLKGGFAILNRWNGTTSRMLLQNGLASHLLSVFATMDLVRSMVSGDKPFFEPMLWHMFANVQTWFGCLAADDRFLALLKSFSDMANLGNVVYSCLPARDSLPLIERCLPAIENILPQPRRASFTSYDGSLEYEESWSAFCAVYQCCGTIYAQRALRLKPIDDETVQRATRHGVEMLIDNILPGMMSHCLIFPILVIGIHCIHSQDRRAVMDALSPTSSYLSFGSLQLMCDFLQESWATMKTESDWWQCFAKVSDRAFFF